MTLTNWDPLKYSLSEEIVGAVTKRQIKNILKSYTGWYDPFSEMLQNALDALEARKKNAGPGYTPRIWIMINLKENQISVTENGIGFNEQEFKSFLAPNVSFKEGKTRGNKGVGATYLGYGFNFLQIGTKKDGFTFVGNIEKGREWVEDVSNTKTRPEMKESNLIHKEFNSIDQGSTFTLKLSGDFIRPKDLKWVGANTVDQWGAILRIKTPLGGIYIDSSIPGIECALNFIDEKDNSNQRRIDKCEYIYPHNVISTCKALNDVLDYQKELSDKGKDASKLPSYFYKLNGLYNYWNADQIMNEENGLRIQFDEKEKKLVSDHRVSIYGFLCYSTNVWDEYNDNILKLRKGGRILKGGIQLATNSMPQGEMILIPLTRNLWYQNVTHIIVHFDSADPDLGRKGFQPELESLAKKISTSVVGAFLNWKKLLRQETGAPPNIVEEKGIRDWILEQEKHESENPLIISRDDVFLPIREPSITSKPLNEQDVIALFNQLMAGGVIRGVKIMATNQHQQYDGICRFRLQPPIKNHIFDKFHNPLGIEESKASSEFISIPKILEYKYSFDALIDEFEKEEKTERNIQLVIAWTMGDNWAKRYEIVPLLYLPNLHHRDFHGATHIIKNSLTGDIVFPAIILSELIEYINDPDSVQEYQKKYLNF